MQSIGEPFENSSSIASQGFYKPMQFQSDLNHSRDPAMEDDIAMEIPRALGSGYKDSLGDPMEIDDEPQCTVSPGTKLREFKQRMKHAENLLVEAD